MGKAEKKTTPKDAPIIPSRGPRRSRSSSSFTQRNCLILDAEPGLISSEILDSLQDGGITIAILHRLDANSRDEHQIENVYRIQDLNISRPTESQKPNSHEPYVAASPAGSDASSLSTIPEQEMDEEEEPPGTSYVDHTKNGFKELKWTMWEISALSLPLGTTTVKLAFQQNHKGEIGIYFKAEVENKRKFDEVEPSLPTKQLEKGNTAPTVSVTQRRSLPPSKKIKQIEGTLL